MPTGQPHETSPAEFLAADQDAYRTAAFAEAARCAREEALAADDPPRAYPQRRRARRSWRARLLRVGR